MRVVKMRRRRRRGRSNTSLERATHCEGESETRRGCKGKENYMQIRVPIISTKHNYENFLIFVSKQVWFLSVDNAEWLPRPGCNNKYETIMWSLLIIK